TIALISRSHRGEPLPALEPAPETRAQVTPAGGR
ncbi:malonate carrier protein, partial [Pseudomonas putida SJ3]